MADRASSVSDRRSPGPSSHGGQVSARAARYRPIVVADRDQSRISWLRACLDSVGSTWPDPGPGDSLHIVSTGADAVRAVAELAPCVLVAAARLGDMSAADVVAEIVGRGESEPQHEHNDGHDRKDSAECQVLIWAEDEAGEQVDLAVSEADLRVFYFLDQRMGSEQIATLVGRAAVLEGESEAVELAGTEDATRLSRLLDIARQFAAQASLQEASDNLEAGVVALTRAGRAHCLFHDPSDGALWSESSDYRPQAGSYARRGLVGYAARTGKPAIAARADADPRYHRGVDDPDGRGTEALMACPVVSADGTVHAVLVAVRDGAVFSAVERQSLADLAEHLGPLMHQKALRVEADSVIEAAHSERLVAEDLFRAEALAAYLSRGKKGDVVRVLPSWVRWVYWPLLALLMASAILLVVGTVDQYSAGPAIVRMSGRSEVTANASGSVVSVAVIPGQRVKKGQVLARLHDAGEAAEFERLENEFHTQLRNRMLDPGDQAASQAVRTLRTSVASARTRLEQRIVRAPRPGTISDVRIRPGQHLVPGDLVVSLVDDDTALTVVALLPGKDRPQLKPGMSLRMELSGYRYAYQSLVIESVDDEIIGPAEARRYLGGRIADGIAITGPVVVVEAQLPQDTFEADAHIYRYHDGMQGTVEALIGQKSVATVLIPQLDRL
ncbi:MAG: HlyD family efflux transporter periplasmic adaptor subunit [Proteobacteria bacterium]|nr:HlyD family efflux transporter periplasmic adaptor subunit [Pseudomonadota bacterium]